MPPSDVTRGAERAKRLWAVVADAQDPARQYRLVLKNVSRWPDAAGRGVVHNPWDLIETHPIDSADQPAGRPIGSEVCGSGLECLGLSVYRLHDTQGTVSGEVYAFRGLVHIEDNAKLLAVTGLVEVRFTKSDRVSGNSFPELGPADRGQLVATWDQRPIGLLVAGEGYVGYVAPVAEFLQANHLTLTLYKEVDVELSTELRYLDRTPVLIDAGLDALTGELNREHGAPAEPADLWAT
jgi:hypothetical protein